MRRHAATLAAAATLLVVVVAAASHEERHQVGSNWVRPVVFAVADLPAGERVCQPGMKVPEGTEGIGMRIGTYDRPGPPLRLTISRGGPAVTGGLGAGWRQGDVVVPVPELAAERRDARVCVVHDGDGELAIAGGPTPGPNVSVGGEPIDAMIRLEYVEGEREPWWSVVGALPDRLAVARDALPGPATLPLFALLAVAVLGGGLALVAREGRR